MTRRVEPILTKEEALNIVIDYKNYEDLARFISDRSKLYNRKRTGLSAKQQRKLAVAVARARHLGFLPYSQTI